MVSPKTVERHLSSVYRKRNLRSRTELGADFRGPDGLHPAAPQDAPA